MNRLPIIACAAYLLCVASAQAAEKPQITHRAVTVPGVVAPVVPPTAPAIPPIHPVAPAPQVAVPPAQGLILPSSAVMVPTEPAQVPTDAVQIPASTHLQNGTGQP